MKQFAREHDVSGTLWQWVGYPQEDDRSVTLLTAFGGPDWTYMPTITLETRNGESQQERFEAFVDNFLHNAKESG